MSQLRLRYPHKTPPPILTPNGSLAKTTGHPPPATQGSRLPTPNKPPTSARVVTWLTSRRWWLRPRGTTPRSSVSLSQLEPPCSFWTSSLSLHFTTRKIRGGMSPTGAFPRHSATRFHPTRHLPPTMWPTCRARSWCRCRWSSSSWSTSTTTSASRCRPTTRCASLVRLTTPSPCAGRLTTYRWWLQAPSQWSPTHWLACSLCTISILLVAARTVPTYPTATPPHGYSSAGMGRRRIPSESPPTTQDRHKWLTVWSTDSKVSTDVILLSCLMKIFKVNVTIVITLFGSKLHGRFLRSFTKRNGNQGMTVNILTLTDEQFLCDKEAFTEAFVP